jgi:catechol 2,3-dioxygenase-like lactoylglutathione lyase family enzyme
MQLNHLDLPVPDVAAASALFQKHFGFVHLQTNGNHGLAVLRGEGGFILVLTRRPAGEVAGFPGSFHIGFQLDSEAAVRHVHARLLDAPVEELGEMKQMRGSWPFYLHMCGGIMVEISHRPS